MVDAHPKLATISRLNNSLTCQTVHINSWNAINLWYHTKPIIMFTFVYTQYRRAYHLHGIFGWDFWDKMEQHVSSGKNGRCCTICQKWPSWLGRVVPRFSRPMLIKDGEGWTIIFGRSSRWQFLWRGMTAYSCLLMCWLHSWGEIWIGVMDILRSHSLDEFKAHFRMRKAPCEILLREVLASGHTFLVEILLEEGSLIRASS